MTHPNGSLGRKLRMGLIGGGEGAFIGRVHATAAIMDGRAELVAGALSSNPARAVASAEAYDIVPERAYPSFDTLLREERKLHLDKAIDFVSIATPNHTHFPIAKAAIQAGFDVVCDKPMTFDLKEAEELVGLVEKSGVVFALTHNYTGNPLVRQARDMILTGDLGEIQAIRAQYIQGWLRTRLETEEGGGGHKQAAWRTDPTKSGAAGCLGDIGVHAYNLARYMTCLIPDVVSARLKTFEPGRLLDDYGHAIIRFTNGALGSITASQISHGRENDLSIEIDGTAASLRWNQEEPNKLFVLRNGQPQRIYTRNGGPYISSSHKDACRVPSGHPEGYLEAFANVYRSAFDAMVKRAAGQEFQRRNTVYPNVHDGLDGMCFIQQCVVSSHENGAWLGLGNPGVRV